MAQENRMDLGGISLENLFTDEVIEKEEKTEETEVSGTDEKERKTEDIPENVSKEGNPKDEGNESGDDPDNSEGDSESEISLFHQLNEEFGIELEDEFKEDYDGIKGYVQKVGSELATRQLNELFERFPVAAELIDYMASGGDPQKFFESGIPDMSNLTLTEENESMQEKVMRMKLRDDGFEEADITERIEAYKSAAMLYKESEAALKILKKRQENETEQMRREREEAERLQNEEYNRFVANTSEVIKKGTLANVQIPEKEKKAFLEFIFRPVDKTGRTQRELQREKLSLEQRLELEYLVYKGLNIGDVIVAKKQTQNLAHLRKNAEKEASKMQRNGASPQKQKTALPEGYSLDSLF
jgi:hypothetical protein